MTELTYDLRSFIQVERVKPNDATWPIPSPFDLRFKSQRLNAEQSDAISGTGIYLISKGLEVVYLGKYQPENGKIIADRWGRHLQTITARGYNIGLGGKIPELRLAELMEAVAHPNLRQVLQAAYAHDCQRFRDTGYNTTPNRLRFASENWDLLGTSTPERVLDDIAFSLVRMPTGKPKAEARSDVSRIEKHVLLQYKPCCNIEYRHAEHRHRRVDNTLPNILSAVRKSMKDVTGFNIMPGAMLQG
jgi:hypothetical protein